MSSSPPPRAGQQTPVLRRIDETLTVRDGHLFVEGCDVTDLTARFGSPLYVLSEARLRSNARRYLRAFGGAWPHGDVRVLPSLKANFALAVGRILVEEGLGCDVFGPGEFHAALRVGVAPELVSLNGSIKDQPLIDEAVRAGARITLDSRDELDRVIDAARRLGRSGHVRLRARPDYRGLDLPTDFLEDEVPVSEATRRYKAGIPTPDLIEMGEIAIASDEVRLSGLMVHLPRHRVDFDLWRATTARFAALVVEASRRWDGWRPEELDLGGGLPTRRDPTGGLLSRVAGEARAPAPTTEEYADAICGSLAHALTEGGVVPEGIAFEVEPGRGLFADVGIHLATVRHIKREDAPVPWTWVETDTSEMFLLDGIVEHNLWECLPASRMGSAPDGPVDVVGRSCGFDLIVPDADLPTTQVGDVLAFLDTGAYQDASATNFNAMPRPGTVLVNGAEAEVVRRPETLEDVFARDAIPERLRGAGTA
jgi:diaminopimelate decarboxylase